MLSRFYLKGSLDTKERMDEPEYAEEERGWERGRLTGVKKSGGAVENMGKDPRRGG